MFRKYSSDFFGTLFYFASMANSTFRKYSSKIVGTLFFASRKNIVQKKKELFFASIENSMFRKYSFKIFGTLFLQVSKIRRSENVVPKSLELYFCKYRKFHVQKI